MATAGKVIKCKAAVAWEPNKPLVIEEIEVAPPQANEVRIKIVATGVCHTDLYHLFEGMHKDGFPAVLGHEGAGIVESVGPGVTEFQPGDKVIPLFTSQCRECRFCKNPNTNKCDKGWVSERPQAMSSADTRFTCKGKKVLQFVGTSTFSEYTVLNQMAVAKIDPAAPLDKVCLLGCGVCTGYGAAVNTAKRNILTSNPNLKCCVDPSLFYFRWNRAPHVLCLDWGLWVWLQSWAARLQEPAGLSLLTSIQRSLRRQRCGAFGATDFVNPKDHNKPINKVLSEMTDGGVDYSLECVGNVEVMRSALESCIGGWGVSVIVGWTDLHDISFRPVQLISGRTWKGSMFGGFKGKDGVPQMVKAYLDKKVKLDEFITHNMTLAQVNDAIELMKHGKWLIVRVGTGSPLVMLL
ncbi:hypothetical protein L3Q82_026743 [Scortum barcoo]|uniref:Uncharacterized protein n=1 Tax=Scortum barcoo TaxID=214431 RepID=A0ACB8WKD0_9TELE|nr:hypothetical protein L3Q82_026743 [Scortum barcoo]